MMRERLIELIAEAVGGCSTYWAGLIADHLLAKGVIVPPCNVGDVVYAVDRKAGLWWQGKVITIYFTKFYTGGYDIQYKIGFADGEVVEYDFNDVFFAKEEAEQALKARDEGK